jgi:hypothetical protein
MSARDGDQKGTVRMTGAGQPPDEIPFIGNQGQTGMHKKVPDRHGREAKRDEQRQHGDPQPMRSRARRKRKGRKR